MTSFLQNRRLSSGFTLIEVMLAMGLCAILAVVAVPSILGWLAEGKMRADADQLIKMVQTAKLQAEQSGEAQTVVLINKKNKPKQLAKNTTYLEVSPDQEWVLKPYGQKTPPKDKINRIRIDSQGNVEPVTFRITEGSKYIEYRFDFLTGHAEEEGFSL